MSNNIKNHKAGHEAFNKRDFAAATDLFRPELEYLDIPRGITLKTSTEWSTWAQAWASAFSDAKITDARYIDGGDTTVALFHARGTNDGAMGPIPATGARLDLPFCEVLTFDKNGKVIAGELYYDGMTMMVQLGLAQPPAGS